MIEFPVLEHPVQLARDSVTPRRVGALALVAVLGATLAFAAGWLVAELVAGQWDQTRPVHGAVETSFERDLLAFGAAVPAFAIVAAMTLIGGLTGLRARHRWEGATAFGAFLFFTAVELLIVIA